MDVFLSFLVYLDTLLSNLFLLSPTPGLVFLTEPYEELPTRVFIPALTEELGGKTRT